MADRFEGWYLKHQADGRTLAFIPGRSSDKAFIQVVLDEKAYNVDYPLENYHKDNLLRIQNNTFSRDGITLDIHTDGLDISGRLSYQDMTPIRSDIMGPFRFFPMECRHEVVSMSHQLAGDIMLNGQAWDFNGGKGYIEGDSGRSFPESYTWVQCNDFDSESSIMVSIAKIPFAGLQFWGCICIVWHEGNEYRLATYKGVRIRRMEKNRLKIRQGKYNLLVEVTDSPGHGLPAPKGGNMSRIIHETPACEARFLFTEGDRIILDKTSRGTSYEFVQ